MLGFITRGLVLVLGYAYPAYECYKTVEKNKVGIEELRFWCQYWIIVAILTFFERIGDLFLCWVPLYGEMKLALFIYLWYPKTKGTGYIYGTFFKPYMAKHEPEIDRNLEELKTRGWDLSLKYWKSCFKTGQSTFFQILQFLAAQSGKVSKARNENTEPHIRNLTQRRNRQPSDKNGIPSGTKNRRNITQLPVADKVQVMPPHVETEHIKFHKELEPDSTSSSGSGLTSDQEISKYPSCCCPTQA